MAISDQRKMICTFSLRLTMLKIVCFPVMDARGPLLWNDNFDVDGTLLFWLSNNNRTGVLTFPDDSEWIFVRRWGSFSKSWEKFFSLFWFGEERLVVLKELNNFLKQKASIVVLFGALPVDCGENKLQVIKVFVFIYHNSLFIYIKGTKISRFISIFGVNLSFNIYSWSQF